MTQLDSASLQNVLIDLLNLYDQIRVDALCRLREFNKARNVDAVRFPYGLTP